MIRRILFVCTGNTCRSPMAENMLRHMAKEYGLELDTQSAGIAAGEGVPIAENAKQVLSEMHIDAEGTSQPLTEALISWADLILTMTSSHKSHILIFFPELRDKVFTLKEYSSKPGTAGLDGAGPADLSDHDAGKPDVTAGAATGNEGGLDHSGHDDAVSGDTGHDVDISDPFGGDLAEYKRCAAEIETSLREIFNKWTDAR